MFTEANISALRGSFNGAIHLPESESYDASRRLYNAMIDRRPGVILVCGGTSDVVSAVNFARENKAEVSVRGGGHNVAGKAVCDGGVMIDLSAMKGIHVDPARRTARAQAGVAWGELNRETQAFGLATTGGVISSTGIAGLTLGGGIGYLMGRFGVAADNLLSAQIVTADGAILTASNEENPDLFWAVRGGGGNFGIVTSFEYQLHKVGPEILGGLIMFPYDSAVDVLKYFRDLARSLPDEIGMQAGLVHAPDGSGLPLSGMIVCCSGSKETGQAHIEKIRQFGSPVMDGLGPITYEGINSMLDESMPRGVCNYWKSGFLSDLPDAAIETMVEGFAKCPSNMGGMFLEHFHGAATRVPVDATAFGLRSTGDNFILVSQWADPSQNEANISWTREMYAAMEPFFSGGMYVNYIDVDGDQRSVQSAYGSNLARLREVKGKYDPSNFFHLNQNILPA